MTETERVLRVLIHDARTPLGVAQGYMRLLHEERLETPEERERALSRAMDALGRIARLCDDASGFLVAPQPSPQTTTISAAFLVAAVEARVRAWDFAVSRGTLDSAARIRLGASAERLAEAIASVAGAVRHGIGAKSPRLHAETGGAGLAFIATAQPESPPVNGVPERSPFDAWGAGGLIVPLACRLIHETGGHVDRRGPEIVIAFPTEASA
ncbi:MAG TPA: histidine kinase dimerization/phospho-acceptor domain-containing protein [Vicinamibacterales bacterium]|nr:histidine kinase dimerization/phospho-acceptor domain-containing protein [Vicinamibacterales bacterium]